MFIIRYVISFFLAILFTGAVYNCKAHYGEGKDGNWQYESEWVSIHIIPEYLKLRLSTMIVHGKCKWFGSKSNILCQNTIWNQNRIL